MGGQGRVVTSATWWIWWEKIENGGVGLRLRGGPILFAFERG